MRVLVSWLRELVDLPTDVDDIARRLTMAGLEVEGIESLSAGLDKVVVGEVRQKTPIEGTKLNVCQVFDGTTVRQIVCGAQNYSVGDHVPAALPGAILPGGKAIGDAKLRGVDSFGMLCSSKELGAEDGVDGLMILSKDTVPGTPMAKILGRDGHVLELNVTPNRADALSHFGVARELGALYEKPVKPYALNVPAASGETTAKVETIAPELCPRFTGRVIEGVKVGPSPAWLRQGLEALGQRSVNNVVDATNYVLFALGQPVHAYDLDRVAGARLTARLAKAGETLKTLDGKDRSLFPDDLVIADAERAVGLAGVMGGEDSEVKEGTTRLLLECAFFSPGAVRRSAKRHGIHSEASHRFERGIDPENTRFALDLLTETIVKLAGGTVVGPVLEAHPKPHVRAEITLRHARVESVLGTKVAWSEATEILRRLGLEVTESGAGAVHVKVPGFRLDLTTEIDLVEEIGRIHGFDAITPTVLGGAGTFASENASMTATRRVRNALSGSGFHEVMNFAFVPADDLAKATPGVKPILVRNPLTVEQGAMRTTLLTGLLRNVAHNRRHGTSSLRLYEIGRVYLARAEKQGVSEQHQTFTVATEPRRLSLVATGERQGGWTGGKDAVDFYDLKGAVERILESAGISGVSYTPAEGAHLHPRAAANVIVGGKSLGTLGELHPVLAKAFDLPAGVFLAELDLDAICAAATLVPQTHDLPRFPASLRDVAIVVDDAVTAADVIAEIRAAAPAGVLEDATLFDVYKGAQLGEGKKNLAFSLRLRAVDRTLTDEEVNAAHQAIVGRLGQKFGAALRA